MGCETPCEESRDDLKKNIWSQKLKGLETTAVWLLNIAEKRLKMPLEKTNITSELFGNIKLKAFKPGL